MRKVFLAIIFAFTLLATTSCVTTGYAQENAYGYEQSTVRTNIDIEIVIRYGTPFLMNGLVHYYLYNGLYYYPYYFNNHFYYNVYNRPLLHYPRYWRPLPKGYWFRGNKYDNHHFNKMRRHNSMQRFENNRNRMNESKYSSIRNVRQRSNSRVNTQKHHSNSGHFGGKR